MAIAITYGPLTPEQVKAVEVLSACGEAERIAVAQALLPPGFEVMQRPSQEAFDGLLAGLRDGTVDWREPGAIERALAGKPDAS